MKVVLLGAGAMGSITLKDLVETSEAEVVVADYNGEQAERLAASYGSPRVRAARADATDVEATASLLEGAFAAINAVQYQLNLQVMRAALKARCHYVDLGGLFHVTLEQRKLHDEFVAAERLALLGLGAAPGTTNLLARLAADELDRVDEIHILVAGAPTQGEKLEFGYSIQTILEEACRPAAVLKDGQITFVEPMSGADPVTFPNPVGVRRPGRTIHSEVTNLAGTYAAKGLRECSFSIAFEDHLVDKLRFLREIGINAMDPIAVKGQTVIPHDVLVAVLNRTSRAQAVVDRDAGAAGLPREGDGYEILRAVVRGSREGRNVVETLDCHVPGIPEWGLGVDVDTGCPPSIGVQMLHRGEITARGALPPEQAVPTGPYFAELAKRKMTVVRSREQ